MEQIIAPYGQEIELRQIIHDSGIQLLRVVVRDGAKYQIIDLDPATAHRWGVAMVGWAGTQDR